MSASSALSRRGFIGALSAAVAGAIYDPELLLWKPGAKTIFLPPVRQLKVFTVVDVVTSDATWLSACAELDRMDIPKDVGMWFRRGDTFTIEGIYA
jgi:hypothetical protein